MSSPLDQPIAPPWEHAGQRIADAVTDTAGVAILGSDGIAAAEVALGIARVQARRRRVLVCDAIGELAPIEDLVPLDATYGLVDAMVYGVSLARVAHAADAARNLNVLPSGPRPIDYESLFGSAVWPRLIASVRATEALVLVIASPGAPGLPTLLRALDGVVAVGTTAVPDDVKVLAVARRTTPAQATPTVPAPASTIRSAPPSIPSPIPPSDAPPVTASPPRAGPTPSPSRATPFRLIDAPPPPPPPPPSLASSPPPASSPLDVTSAAAEAAGVPQGPTVVMAPVEAPPRTSPPVVMIPADPAPATPEPARTPEMLQTVRMMGGRPVSVALGIAAAVAVVVALVTWATRRYVPPEPVVAAPTTRTDSSAQRAPDSSQRSRDSTARADSGTIGPAAAPPSSSATAATPIIPTATSDSGVLAYAVELATSTNPTGANSRLDLETRSGMPAATYSPLTAGDGGRTYHVIGGAFPDSAAADSALRALRRRRTLAAGAGRVARLPYAVLVQSGVSPDQVSFFVNAYHEEGLPVYSLVQHDGTVRLYAGAFATPDEAQSLLATFRARGEDARVAERTGRGP